MIKNDKLIKYMAWANIEQPFIQRMLYILLFAAFILAATLTISSLLMDMQTLAMGSSIALVINVIMLWFTYEKRLWVPRILIPSLGYITATFICVSYNGIHDTTMFVYPVVILLAGILISATSIIPFTLIIIGTVSMVGYADMTNRLFSPMSQYTGVADIIIVDVQLLITGGIFRSIIGYLHKSLDSAKQRDSESILKLHEFQSKSVSLEKQIEERTRRAVLAEENAEKANSALERRTWQYAGMARLSEMMRGEQDVSTLAYNVIRSLCEYLKVQIEPYALRRYV